MKKVKKKVPRNLFFAFLVLIIILYVQYVYIALFPNVYGINMEEFAANRNVYSSSIYAKRGTIYDSSGNILALDVTSYRVIAYLDESRTGSSKELYHIVDKELTAKSLVDVLGGSYDYYLNLLNPDSYQYQTYLGVYGNNITESEKTELENLNLPGIEFEESYKRYYPNGDFASYNIGYAKTQNSITFTVDNEYNLYELLKPLFSGENITFKANNDNILIDNHVLEAKKEGTAIIYIYQNDTYIGFCNVVITNEKVITSLEEKIYGELGIESYYDDILRGINGYLSYQADRYGYKIPDTDEERIDAVAGDEIHLTLDSTIQRILETAITNTEELYEPEWITYTIMDAKTGDILGSASSPSFNPNDLNTIENYENPLTSFVYEPGSVMKTYTYMCALEKGNYKGDNKFLSGVIEIGGEKIYDWNTYGWGEITYDQGFLQSSNVGVSYMLQEFITIDELKECFEKYGFGEITGIDLPREMTGNIDFSYLYEASSAAFGQGISTTPIQHLQALTMIANNGDMIKPNIIDKIVTDGEIVYQSTVEKVENVITEETAAYLRELMLLTVSSDYDDATGSAYQVDGLDVIGKTGTGQYYSEEHGGYTKYNNVYSFAGMFPYENPEVIIFASIKEPNVASSRVISSMVQPTLEPIAEYLGIIENDTDIDSYNEVVLENYKNEETNTVVKELEELGMDVVVLGEGDIIVDQYPVAEIRVLTNDTIFLKTNHNITTPDFTGYSKVEAIALLNLLDIEYEIIGNGVVESQSINYNEPLSDITLILKKED